MLGLVTSDRAGSDRMGPGRVGSGPNFWRGVDPRFLDNQQNQQSSQHFPFTSNYMSWKLKSAKFLSNTTSVSTIFVQNLLIVGSSGKYSYSKSGLGGSGRVESNRSGKLGPMRPLHLKMVTWRDGTKQDETGRGGARRDVCLCESNLKDPFLVGCTLSLRFKTDSHGQT